MVIQVLNNTNPIDVNTVSSTPEDNVTDVIPLDDVLALVPSTDTRN